MPWFKVSSDIWQDVSAGTLSADAFTLYVTSAAYASRWNIEDVPQGVTRLALGRMSRKAIRELVDAGLWEPTTDRRYRVAREGELWKRLAPSARPRRAIPLETRIEVYQRDGFCCVTCGRNDELSIDHIHPHSLGGSDRVDNLQTLCRPCNSRKGARVQ